jgi:outer membrane lipoprotein-sorting protein
MIIKRFLLALTMCCAAFAVDAQTAAQKGKEIAERADSAGAGFGDFVVSGAMTLRTSGGAKSSRKFETKTIELSGSQASRSLLVFDWPGDIRGTALLTHSYDEKQDSQWLYLPSVGRVKKIAGSGRSGSFVGSEFAYEDMVEQDASNFDHVWLRDEGCPGGGGQCYVLQRVPTQKSGYSQQVIWIDKSELRYRSIQYFNRRGQLAKTLTIQNYKKYKGRFWRPGRMSMINHLTGKSTLLDWSGYKFNQGLQKGAFTRDAMTRLR